MVTRTDDTQGSETPESYTLDARLDRIPTTSRHILWITILGIAYFVEIFDNVVFSLLAPSVRAEWDLEISQIGLVTSAVFVGALIGAFLGGRLSDRFGRRPILIIACVVFSAGSLLSAIAPSWEILLASRALTGIGMQAAVGVLLVIVSEIFPSLSRGRYFTALTFIGFVASPATSFIALAIVPLSTEAWRSVFAIGGVGIIVAILVALFLPETVRWQVTHGKTAAAERTVLTLESAVIKSGRTLPEPTLVTRAPAPRSSMRDLVRGENLRRLVVISVAFFAYLFCLYGFSSWIPTILTDRGMEQQAALQFFSIVSIATVIGPLILYPFADRVERKTLIFTGSVVTAAALTVFALVTDPTASLVAAFIGYLAATSMTVSFYTYIPEVFPTEVRGAGVGVVNGLGRVAGVLSGITVAAVYTAWGFQWLYILLAAIFLLTGTIIMIFGVRTTRRSLEAIATNGQDTTPAPITQPAASSS